MLQVNTQAPAFSFTDANNKQYSLSDYAGKYVVLYFYPKDDTPGCTVEAKEFADLSSDFTKNNAVIIGVSKDGRTSHKKFTEKYCLPFDLIADEDKTVCQAYGVLGEKSRFGKKYIGIHRTTFLIGKDGKILQIWNNVKPEGHAAAVLKSIVDSK